ncbi:MAG: ankyrin repeat domain-containing protein, partial [Legionella sp.]|nr:ankyrin repeat domain-containing protein [Legionella sp.]
LLVQKLIQADSSLTNLKDNAQKTPLSLAAAKGHDHLVALLISHGAKPNQSALDDARKNKHEGCVSILKAPNKYRFSFFGQNREEKAGAAHLGRSNSF